MRNKENYSIKEGSKGPWNNIGSQSCEDRVQPLHIGLLGELNFKETYVMKKRTLLLGLISLGFTAFPYYPASAAPGDNADMSIDITADDNDGVVPDQNVTYTTTITNNGPDASGPITVVYSSSTGQTFVSETSPTGTCTGTDTVTCVLDSLPDDGTTTITLVYNIDTTGLITNGAVVTLPDTTDPEDSNNEDAFAIVSRNADGSCSLIKGGKANAGNAYGLGLMAASSLGLLMFLRSKSFRTSRVKK